MKIIHIISERNEANGMYRVAKDLAQEQCRQGDDSVVMTAEEFLGLSDLSDGEVWVHGMWLPCEWKAMRKVLSAGGRVKMVRMVHGGLSPIYVRRQGRWKKTLVGPIERYFFRRASRIVATCEDEVTWICKYLRTCPNVEITDLRRFFKLDTPIVRPKAERQGGPLHVLYVGRAHPLKGIQYLRQAVSELNARFSQPSQLSLRVVSNHTGAEREADWEWCDVLCLPTLSENFGRVIAEAFDGRPVITTDGAPAWRKHFEVHPEHGCYLKGYCAAGERQKVEMLKNALKDFVD